MTLKEMLAAYDQVRVKHGLPQMQSARLELEPMELDDPEAVWARVCRFGPSAGWLCFQSVVKEVGEEGWEDAPDEQSGVLLSAECFNDGSGESLHLRQSGRGGWLLTRYLPGNGPEYLADEVKLLAHDRDPCKPRYLRYRRYWEIDAEAGAEAVAACFIGYQE